MKNVNLDLFHKSTLIQDATIRRLQVIGESAKNISPDIRKNHSEVEWMKITGMRDKLVHDYFEVELDLAWKVVQKDIPILKKQIKKIKKELKSGQQRIV